jgi:Zn-dependent membrane protease YugP
MLSFTSLWIFLSIVILAFCTKWRAKKTFSKYSRLESASGITAKQMANSYLNKIGANEVRLEEVNHKLNDRYNPTTKSLRISYPESCSLTALGVTAHELGHLQQHADEYHLLDLHSQIVFASNLISQIAFPIFMAGFILQLAWLTRSGLILYLLAVISVFFTLPIEFDASKKALRILRKESFIKGKAERKGARKVLFAAGLTYIASPALAFLHPIKKLVYYPK